MLYDCCCCYFQLFFNWLSFLHSVNPGSKNWRTVTLLQGSCGSLKVLELFSRFSRPGKSSKTDMVLENPWICVWRSLKVLEFDFLKRRDRTSWYWKRCSSWLRSDLKCAQNPFSAGASPKTPLGELMMLIYAYKVLVWLNLALLLYPLCGRWKSLISPWIWFWQMGKNPVSRQCFKSHLKSWLFDRAYSWQWTPKPWLRVSDGWLTILTAG